MKLPAKLAGAARLWRRIAPKNTTGVVVTVSVLFGALLVLGIYRVQGTADTPSARRAGVGAVTGAAQLDAHDPVARFVDTHVGQVLYAPRVGDDCQRVLFDNRTGVQYDSAPISCIRPAREALSEAAADRIGPLTKGFPK
jgi:hypothetical protein